MPRSPAYARSALHSREKRTWSAIARRPPPKRAQSSIQNDSRARNSSISSSVTAADGSASSPGHAANADADLYGEPARGGGPQPGPRRERGWGFVRRPPRVGRAERQHLPPRLPRIGEPVGEAVRV